MNLGTIMQAKQGWDTFKSNHPKFPAFLSAVNRAGIPEGAVINIDIAYPDGHNMKTNLRVTRSDLELFETAREIIEERDTSK